MSLHRGRVFGQAQHLSPYYCSETDDAVCFLRIFLLLSRSMPNHKLQMGIKEEHSSQSKAVDELNIQYPNSTGLGRCLYSNSFWSLRRCAPHFGCRGWSHLPAPTGLHQGGCDVAEASEQSEHPTGDAPAARVVRQQQRHNPQIEVGDSRNEAQDLPARTLCR